MQKISESPNIVRLPSTNPEREAFARFLVAGCLGDGNESIIIAPVCPDYGENEAFHTSVNVGVGKEADAAMHASRVLDTIFHTSIPISFVILVADTETDNEDILARCAHNDREEYLSICAANAALIKNRLSDMPNVAVSTFSSTFGTEFTKLQYEYVSLIHDRSLRDAHLMDEIQTVSQGRSKRHTQILGREEKGYELTIRYMAQYAALGALARLEHKSITFLNYPTPNAVYFNAATYRDIFIMEEDREVIPVLESVIQRRGE